MTINQRVTAKFEGELVIFLIGLRMNRPWKVHRWLPVVSAMRRMIAELRRNPDLGFLCHEQWFGRTTIMVQYWRSLDQLLNYARSANAEHLPAWRAFNQVVGTNGDIGIWHETYCVAPGARESIYVNMPPFGLGRAGRIEPISGRDETAAGRMGK